MSEHAVPGPRATHALLDVMEILRDDGHASTAVYLEPVVLDIAAMHDLLTQQDKDMRQMCQDSLDAAREITRLRKLIAAACALAEQRLTVEAQRYNSATADFIAANTLAQVLSGEEIRPFSIQLEPRSATGGG